MRRTAIALMVLLVGACGGEAPRPDSGGSTDAGASEDSGTPWFEEAHESVGIDFTWRSGHGERLYFPEIMGGGAALFDMDRDGDLDVYFVQAGGVLLDPAQRPGNVLYRNEGDGTFTDVSEGSGAQDRGFGMGVAVGDFDNDGLDDLYVTNLERNTLLHNLGGGHFEDVTERAGVGGRVWTASAGFFDYDRDGDLDLFVVNYIHWSVANELVCSSKLLEADYCSPKSYAAPAPDVLYRNEGDGTFTDVSAEVGLRTAFGNGLGVVMSDFDMDGFEDVFVANDGMKNQLWHNDGGKGFHDVGVQTGCAVDQDGRIKAGMGTHVVDYDDDGDEDLLVVNLTGEPDTFFRNDRDHFTDRTPLMGLTAVSRPYTRFGMGFCDFDLDGYVDLFQASGRVTRSPDIPGERTFDQPNLLFRGSASGRFEEVRPQGGTRPVLSATSRAAAFGDLDGDGSVDIVIVNRDRPAHVLLNRAAAGKPWIGLRVVEPSGRAALGAVVEVEFGGRTVTRRVRSAFSYCAANDPTIHVGIGEGVAVSEVRVRWPDGTTRSFGALDPGRVHVLGR